MAVVGAGVVGAGVPVVGRGVEGLAVGSGVGLTVVLGSTDDGVLVGVGDGVGDALGEGPWELGVPPHAASSASAARLTATLRRRRPLMPPR